MEKADEKIKNFLSWKNSKEIMAANQPKIQELQKEILFLEWESQLMKDERETYRERDTMNGVIESINNSLYMSNLFSDCSPRKLSK